MRYAIIENEYFALENLRTLMARLMPEAELVFTAESVRESISFFRLQPRLDLVFMDIELVDGNCFDILEQVEVDTPVIFTTAYDNYALEAFKLDTIDYLLKPVSEETLSRAVGRYVRRPAPTEMRMEPPGAIERPLSYPTRVLVADGDTYSYIQIDEIACFFAEEKYTFLTTIEGRDKLTLYTSLSKIEEDMNPSVFFRLSRKMIVNIGAVCGVSKYFNGRLKVEVKCGCEKRTEIVSPSRRSAFLNWLGASGLR